MSDIVQNNSNFKYYLKTKGHSAAGPDDIPSIHNKMCTPELAPTLSNILYSTIPPYFLENSQINYSSKVIKKRIAIILILSKVIEKNINCSSVFGAQ